MTPAKPAPKPPVPAKPVVRITAARSAPPPPKALPVEALDRSEYQPMRERLLHQKNEMTKLYRQDLIAGQEAADDGTDDIVDRANNAYNRELNFSLSDGERLLLLQIEDALRRLDNDHYGHCASCQRPIARPRLEAIPWAKLCIDCQEMAEKGLLSDSDY